MPPKRKSQARLSLAGENVERGAATVKQVLSFARGNRRNRAYAKMAGTGIC